GACPRHSPAFARRGPSSPTTAAAAATTWWRRSTVGERGSASSGSSACGCSATKERSSWSGTRPWLHDESEDRSRFTPRHRRHAFLTCYLLRSKIARFGLRRVLTRPLGADGGERPAP